MKKNNYNKEVRNPLEPPAGFKWKNFKNDEERKSTIQTLFAEKILPLPEGYDEDNMLNMDYETVRKWETGAAIMKKLVGSKK